MWPSQRPELACKPAAQRHAPTLPASCLQAAELAANLVDWEAVEPRRSRLLRAQLERLAATKGLSSVVSQRDKVAYCHAAAWEAGTDCELCCRQAGT